MNLITLMVTGDSQLLLYQSYLYYKHGKYYILLVKLTVTDDEVLVEPRDPKT